MTVIEPALPDRPAVEAMSMAEQLFTGCLTDDERERRVHDFLEGLSAHDAEMLPWSWSFWSRPTQRPPGSRWKVWMVRAGRGFGKTRCGAEETRRRARSGLARRIAFLGATAGDVRDVMVEGESGIMAVSPNGARPHYEPTKRRLTWPNGAIGTLFSAEEPDRLRGPQHDWLWADEPASWKTGPAAWDNAMFGLRLGKPAAVITGTPRPLPWLRELEKQRSTVVTTGTTYDNLANLAEEFIELVLGRYEGTRLGRQELHAHYLDDVEGALWQQAALNAARVTRFSRDHPGTSLALELGVAPHHGTWRILVAVDPPGETAECGIVVGMAPIGGKAGRHHAVVLDDMSIAGPPEVWGAQVVAAVRKWDATKVMVESNQGGDMVRSTIHNVDSTVVVEKIRASKSKYDRAEPISVLYARGWVHHAGWFGALESQLTTWVPTEGKSPDRLDALVHLITTLLEPTPMRRASAHSPVGRRIA